MISEELRIAIEETADAENDVVRRPDTIVSHNTPQGRIKTLQIRLTDDEYEQLAALAGDKPISTVARSLLFTAVAQHNTQQAQAQAEQALRDALAQAGYALTKIDNEAA